MKVICNNADICRQSNLCLHRTEHEHCRFGGILCDKDKANNTCFDGMGCDSKCGQPRKCVPIFIELVREVLKKNGIQ